MSSPTDEIEEQEPEQEVSNPLRVILPADPDVCREVRRLLGDGRASIEHLTDAVSCDPIVVIELLKMSNSVNMAPGKTQVTSISNAIIALGFTTVTQVIDQLIERGNNMSGGLLEHFQDQRARCVETARISRIIARAVSAQKANTAYTTGLMMFVGDMVAIAFLKGRYLEVAESQVKRSKINYRLSQDFEFDVESTGVEFLQKTGIPEKLVSSIDRNSVPQSSDSAEIRTICYAAAEMLEAFDSGRWERLAPGQKIPSSSSIRMLQLTDPQYQALYEKVSAYFGGAEEESESFTKEEITAEVAATPAAVAELVQSELSSSQPESADHSDQDQSDGCEGNPGDDAMQAEPAAQEIDPPAVVIAPPGSARLQGMFGETLSWLQKAKETKATRAKKEETLTVPEPPVATASRGRDILSSLESLISASENSAQLLTKLLQELVSCGFFEKSALLVVSEDRSKATVHSACGKDIAKGQLVKIEDPMSPLARACAKVQSIANKDGEASPFGSKSFALAPIESAHPTPVILYADCGASAISLAGRRLFRNVVHALNQRLSNIQGGLPD